MGVYLVTLGVPFYVYRAGHPFPALALAVVLATVAPLIYSRLRKRAEDSLLRDERAAQAAIREAVRGIGRLKEIDEIAQFIIDILVKTVKARSAAFYEFDGTKYLLRDALGEASVYAAELPPDGLKTAGMAVPIQRGDVVLGTIILGEKSDGAPFTPTDLDVLSAVLEPAALAIENARFLEDIKAAQEKLFESEKMAAIGFLAGGLSHQLKNRFASLLFYADFATKNVERHRDAVLPAPVCDETLKHLGKISDGIDSSKDVLNGILNYASDRETKTAVSLKELVASSIEFISFKIPPGDVVFEQRIADDVPQVTGNFAQLQEVLFNLIDNAYHSMMEKKAAGVESGYQPRMTFSTVPAGRMIVLVVEDNGSGIRPEDMRRLFTPLFSTKRAMKKGHGLGLYIMRQIVERNHSGRIEFSSDYGRGVKVEICLPVVQ
jgi:signal transduction histidine kinase